MIEIRMRRSTPTNGTPKGRITLRIVLEHMQYNFGLARKEVKDGFDAVDRRFDEVDKRLTRVERSVRNIEAQLDDVEIEKVPDRFKRIEEKVGIC